MTRLSVVGLGKLGAVIAACFAERGFPVTGMDRDPDRVERVRRGEAPVAEPGLAELLSRAGDRLRATTDLREAVAGSDVTFIVVPTPTGPDGGFQLDFVLDALAGVGAALRDKPGPHVVVVTSTVMPGSMGGPLQRALEESSGRRCGPDLGLCYSPEFVALGTVIRDFRSPDLVLIGESDPAAGDLLEDIYRRTCDGPPPIARMPFVSAEVVKLAVNAFVTMKISFANLLARVCSELPGADVDAVTAAVALDGRIGARYLAGSVSYGGPCFPRDNVALAALARSLGVPAGLPEATDAFNRQQRRDLVKAVVARIPAGGVVGVLGLTYKPSTDVVDEALGLEVLRELACRTVPALGYDPAGMDNARRHLGPGVRLATSAAECVRQADVVVLATAWPQFRQLPPDVWLSGPRATPRVLIDCWRALPELRELDGLRYVAVGIGPRD